MNREKKKKEIKNCGFSFALYKIYMKNTTVHHMERGGERE